jgi:hypothetical protein
VKGDFGHEKGPCGPEHIVSVDPTFAYVAPFFIETDPHAGHRGGTERDAG